MLVDGGGPGGGGGNGIPMTCLLGLTELLADLEDDARPNPIAPVEAALRAAGGCNGKSGCGPSALAAIAKAV